MSIQVRFQRVFLSFTQDKKHLRERSVCLSPGDMGTYLHCLCVCVCVSSSCEKMVIEKHQVPRGLAVTGL